MAGRSCRRGRSSVASPSHTIRTFAICPRKEWKGLHPVNPVNPVRKHQNKKTTAEPNFIIAFKHNQFNHLCRFSPKPIFGSKPDFPWCGGAAQIVAIPKA